MEIDFTISILQMKIWVQRDLRICIENIVNKWQNYGLTPGISDFAVLLSFLYRRHVNKYSSCLHGVYSLVFSVLCEDVCGAAKERVWGSSYLPSPSPLQPESLL